jgi:hypothetical protein
MDPSLAPIVVAAARWEQWTLAALRAEHFRALLAARTPRRARRPPPRPTPRARPGLRWMLAVALAGYWLLR